MYDLQAADEGLPYAESQLANVPGALGRFAGKLAARKINIISGYETIEKDSKKASVVLEVPNVERALRFENHAVRSAV